MVCEARARLERALEQHVAVPYLERAMLRRLAITALQGAQSATTCRVVIENVEELRVELAGHGRPQDNDRQAERDAVDERGLARAHQVLSQLCQSRKSWSSARR